jgi:hypothetical protein
MGHTLARPAWPWSLFPMPAATCAAGNWFSQRGVAQRVDLILRPWGVQGALLCCGLLPDCSAQGSLQFAAVLGT